MSCHVGHHKNLPIIAIDNQHAITNTNVSMPHGYRRDVAAVKMVTRMMTPHADAYLVLSFFPASSKRRNTFVFPPLLRQEIISAKPQAGDHVLVYVTAPSKELAALLKQVRCNFIAYGFGIEGQQDNMLFKKPSMDGFLRDLVSAKAVVANAGFSLVSEALYLSKPYLAMPVQNQFEQTFNAYHIDKLGYGAWWEELSKEKVESFLYNLPVYAERLKAYPRAGNDALLAKLDELIRTLPKRGAARNG
jgi:uncharacterized protein (TIGR00661 family)